MSFLSGIMKSIINPATLMQLAMGPAGWASLATKMLVSAIGQQVIQQLGQQLGLPQSIINMAQTAFSAASGTQGMPSTITDAVSQLGQQFNLSPMQQGQLQRAAQNDVNNILEQMATSLSESKEAKDAKSGGSKSWLMAIAENLGKIADKLAKEMTDLSNQIGKGDDQAKASTNVKFGAKSQEFSMFFSSANTVIKTLGEALSSGARKQ